MWLFDLDTETYTHLTEGSAPTFMADGRRVLFASPEQGEFSVIDLATRQTSPATLPPTVGTIESLVLSPDNRHAFVVRVDTESDIWMLDLGTR